MGDLRPPEPRQRAPSELTGPQHPEMMSEDAKFALGY
jgi:hypothetical protein